MRKLLFAGSILLILGVYFFMENQARSSFFATPEEAVSNTADPSLNVDQLIETKIYDQTAYVFFYSQEDETEGNDLSVAEVHQNENGWRMKEAIGLGDMDQRQKGSAMGTEHFIAAYAWPETVRVTYGPYEAEEVELNHDSIKVFFLHDVEDGLESDYLFSYFDADGQEILD